VFKSKNLSPNLLALFASISIATLSSVLVFIFTSTWLYVGIAFIIIGAITYLLIYSILEQFIYRKIKLIYKFISNKKATKREEFYAKELLPPKTIEEVSEEVEQWAKEHSTEIEQLRKNELFRREFLMNLSHELKTPIFSAQGYIHTLLDGAIHDENVNHKFLENAARSIDRLADLVDDLDIISNLESNNIPIIKQPFIIQDLLKEVYLELAQKAEKKRINLIIKKGCEKPLEVFADKQKIKQVLVNLVENSIKYGKESGETNAGIYEVDKATILIEISDDGIGMLKNQVPRVFERFYRTDSARSRKVGGTGLGLAIVKHIVEAHGQTVNCRSSIDVGSTFGFTLDRREK
jgi:two-component system phosphate regulon sensor histidine kinase PhoR